MEKRLGVYRVRVVAPNGSVTIHEIQAPGIDAIPVDGYNGRVERIECLDAEGNVHFAVDP